MADDYYSDGEAPAPGPTQAPDHADERETPEEGKTALLNSEICPGMKVGDELVLKVTGVHEGEYEVAYAPEPKEEEEPTESGEPAGTVGAAPAPSGASMGGGMYD